MQLGLATLPSSLPTDPAVVWLRLPTATPPGDPCWLRKLQTRCRCV